MPDYPTDTSDCPLFQAWPMAKVGGGFSACSSSYDGDVELLPVCGTRFRCFVKLDVDLASTQFQ